MSSKNDSDMESLIRDWQKAARASSSTSPAGQPPLRGHHQQGMLDKSDARSCFQRPASSKSSSFRERDGSFVKTQKDQMRFGPGRPEALTLREPSSPNGFAARTLPPCSSPSRRRLAERSREAPAPPFLNEQFWNACKYGNLRLVRYLLKLDDDYGHDSMMEDDLLWNMITAERPSDGASPLFASAAGGHVAVINLLLRLGAPSMMPRNDGVSKDNISW